MQVAQAVKRAREMALLPYVAEGVEGSERETAAAGAVGPLMDVILLKDVEKVGLRGEVVSVARGYARNFLLPRKLAEEATPARVAELQKRDSRAGAARGDARPTRRSRSPRR